MGLTFSQLDDLEAVKLSLLYLVTFLFLGVDGRKPIPDELMQLVEYMSKFNDFPWGSFFWKVTYSSLKKAIEGRYQKHLERDNTLELVKYTILGFPYAFQVIYSLM